MTQLAVLFAVLGLSISAGAVSAVDFDPANLCTGVSCTENMRAIVDEFSGRAELDLHPPKIASGGCYHLHPQYRPDHEHHTLAVFEPGQSPAASTYRGLFSFYAAQDPYAGFNQAAAREYLLRVSGDKPGHELVRKDGFGRAHIPAETGDIVYWFARSQKDGSLLLVGRWFFPRSGSDTRMFCRLRLR